MTLANERRGVVLIGMPGAGKSTVGVLLAKRLAFGFVDTDLLIQTREGESLQAILDRRGYLELRRIEEQVLLGLDSRRQVVATGGSAVYSAAAMRHLRNSGTAVYLDVPLAVLRERIHDYATRGIACRPGQDLAELFAERSVLYRRHADLTAACGTLRPEQVVEHIVAALERRGATAMPTGK
jgi:shikimate kinase